MPYLFGWSEPLIPNSGSASEGERPDRSDPPSPPPPPFLKHLIPRKPLSSSLLGEGAEQRSKALWSSAGLSRAGRSFSFGFLGLCVYVILSLIDRFDFLARTRWSCSLQGPKPRRGGDWRVRIRSVSERRGEAGESGHRARGRLGCTGGPSGDPVDGFCLRNTFSGRGGAAASGPPPRGFRSPDPRAPPPRLPPGSAPRSRAPPTARRPAGARGLSSRPPGWGCVLPPLRLSALLPRPPRPVPPSQPP